MFNRKLLCAAFALLTAPVCADDRNAAGVELFESEIRPLLVERCYKCHSSRAKELKAKFSLDTREGLLRGGETGPAIIPGKPDQSLLLKALRYDELEMPPDNKLTEAQISAVEKWIRIGAPDPRREKPAEPNPGQIKAGADHWAFQPIRKLDPPKADLESWNQTTVDRFIYARLRHADLKPNPAADRRTLIRRAYFDLTGLPPTLEEVTQFEADSTRNPEAAFRNLIDRLLDSPRYGERWARYWLDVARYADTRGYNFTKDRRFPYAYAYRDYVIRALNDDKPFDQFVLEQLAADQVKLDDARSLAAMGFLTIGRRFTRNHLIIDDRIDVVTRGLMGLTVACARCHDHKYDPIPTQDYYALYGVFSSSHEPGSLPFAGEPERTPEFLAYRKQLEALRAELTALRKSQLSAITGEIRSRAGDYLEFIVRNNPKHRPKRGQLRSPVVRNWRVLLDRTRRERDSLFAAWHAFAALPAEDFTSRTVQLIESPGETPFTPLLLDALRKKPPQSMIDVARAYGELFERAHGEPSNADLAAFRAVLHTEGSPTNLKLERLDPLLNTAEEKKQEAIHKKIDAHNIDHPGAPPRAMVLHDRPNAGDARVFIRGNPARHGEVVPRRFPKVLEPTVGAKPFRNGSGRLELARSIVHPKNPLTARVIVNRVWQHHFGEGLVRTPSNFGALGQRPTHPALLDYLSARLMEEGWSLKKLHRWIMLSQVYQQSSASRDAAILVDPENRLLWKWSRRRHDFESMRDAMLAVGGGLDQGTGGKSFDLVSHPNTTRRTLYAHIDRYDLPRLFGVFDFANPDVSIAQRPTTTIPQQALFMLNSPFMLEQARHAAGRTAIKDDDSFENRIQRLFGLAYQRGANAEEVAWCREFVGNGNARWRDLAQSLLMSNEFLYVD
jgi:hypothetical protein